MSVIQIDTSPEAPFYSPKTLAAKLTVSERTVWNWINSGQLPSYDLGDLRRIDPVDVQAFLANRKDRRRAA